jgi:hypothetical protein
VDFPPDEIEVSSSKAGHRLKPQHTCDLLSARKQFSSVCKHCCTQKRTSSPMKMDGLPPSSTQLEPDSQQRQWLL